VLLINNCNDLFKEFARYNVRIKLVDTPQFEWKHLIKTPEGQFIVKPLNNCPKTFIQWLRENRNQVLIWLIAYGENAANEEIEKYL